MTMTAMMQETTTAALDEPAEIRFGARGEPLAVRWRDRVWPVAGEVQHWFGRRPWWKAGLPGGRGRASLVETEFWRLPVRAAATSPLRTLELCRDPRTEGWRLAKVTDAA
ncbi:DUF6504 family protein [Arthrobacter mobilis]|nr:DUF6504 family protein [Arthrobacter mobilis]